MTSSMTSLAVRQQPIKFNAPPGQHSTHAPHRVHSNGVMTLSPSALDCKAALGQAGRHNPHPRQCSRIHTSSDIGIWDSGLQHQTQRSGQPLKNTEVRTPGPSCMANERISNIKPLRTGLACSPPESSRGKRMRDSKSASKRKGEGLLHIL